MDLDLFPASLRGTVTPPPSKSQAHRAILALALSDGNGTLSNLSPSQDIEATERCAAALKAPPDGLPLLDCGESGSTLRFLIPVALALRGGARFTGHGRLMQRPQRPYFDLFDEKGISYSLQDGVLTVEGELPPGIYQLPGNVSSQFVTGLLYALPLLDGDSEIYLTTELESRAYVRMTLDVLEKFGIQVACSGPRSFRIPGRQHFQARNLTIEADWSQAAFWYAARAMGHPVELAGMDPGSTQGDRAVTGFSMDLAQSGPVSLDVSQCPDLVPPLAAMAAVRQGVTHLTNAARLRLKESDRLAAVREELCKVGVRVEESSDSLTIYGTSALCAAKLDAHNDHRIAMMDAILATKTDGPSVLHGAGSVAKSYPTFWDDYTALGGKIQEV